MPNESTATAVRIPAEVFHCAQMIADESIARDWSIWDFVDRVGTLNAPRDVLAYTLYAATVEMPDALRDGCRVGDTFAADMQRVFGISAEIWERTEALCRAHADRVAPLDDFARAWYDLDGPSPITEEAAHV